AVQDLKGLGYEKGKPVGLVGVTELSEAQKKQLKEQQEMQQMYDMIMKHKRAMQEMQLMWEKAIQQHQHGYDSDEEVDTELGTWEHQLRRMEMDKTRGEGLPGMGTRLWLYHSCPSSEAGISVPAGKPIPVDTPASIQANSWIWECDPGAWGCPEQLLLPPGALTPRAASSRWKEVPERSLSFPLPARGTTAVDGAGFGIDRPAELTKEDDEYEAFRKRMMLAYRFRPNPLNNPRRPYY
ncbi:SUGP1 protein, partial [Smithornis capensis]|nr:SUGP1 protein [Smithornis capensis]